MVLLTFGLSEEKTLSIDDKGTTVDHGDHDHSRSDDKFDISTDSKPDSNSDSKSKTDSKSDEVQFKHDHRRFGRW
ncbi:hypothetical protein C0J52_18004 [Blattella germanica]|nr:hypothetical protein C0J52_18004 [Blattella germanica]